MKTKKNSKLNLKTIIKLFKIIFHLINYYLLLLKKLTISK